MKVESVFYESKSPENYSKGISSHYKLFINDVFVCKYILKYKKNPEHDVYIETVYSKLSKEEKYNAVCPDQMIFDCFILIDPHSTWKTRFQLIEEMIEYFFKMNKNE